MKKHGYLDRVTKYLKSNGVETVVYDRIQPNPVSEHVEEGASVAKANGCDFVVGLDTENLAGFGIKRDDLKTFAKNSFYAMGSLFDITPVKLTPDDVLAIHENAYA
jgi:alcohol dehydrogenase class IV